MIRYNVDRAEDGTLIWSQSNNPLGIGRTGDIAEASCWFWSRKISIPVQGQPDLELSRGSSIDFANTYRHLVPDTQRFDKLKKGFIIGGTDSDEVERCVLLVAQYLNTPHQGVTPAQKAAPWALRQGIYSFHAKQYEHVITYLKPASGQLNKTDDDENAKYYNMLGISYLQKSDTAKFLEKAKTCFEKSVHIYDSNIDAIVGLGRCYKKKAEKEQDDNLASLFQKQAFDQFKKAMNYNSKLGMEELAKCYEEGCGTFKDTSNAERYQKKAAKIKSQDSLFAI